MEKWEEALDDFLQDWKRRDEVTGAMVCGSYVTGAPSKRSDIDVHIILSDEVDWRERGNKISKGYLIEYFANPPEQIRRYFQDDFRDHRTMSMVQFLTGKTIFDRTGTIGVLKGEAAQWINRKQEGLQGASLELKKYGIWDSLDNLRDCFENQRGDFVFVYHNALLGLFTVYCSYLKLEFIPSHQIYTYLTDSLYIDKYLKDVFPDLEFKQLYLSALQEVDRHSMMSNYERLSEHVLQQMGGFHIDGWKLRSPVDI